MKTTAKILLMSSLCAGSLSVYAGGDAAAGKVIAEEKCQACHGLDGNADNPMYPRLAGQYANYMEFALAEYKDGTRQNAIMNGFAAQLSEQDQKDVAAWYASQEGNLHTPVRGRSAAK